MDRAVNTPHLMLNPSTLPTPSGYTHAVVTSPGRLVFLAGQTGHRTDGSIDEALVEQFEQAATNVAIALEAAEAAPQHIVTMQIFVTDLAGYRDALGEVGEAYRRVLGRHYPATSLFEVSSLFDPSALVELVCTAVVPE
ncbi:MAG TPA: RidA family protein [Acidimicrobiia bacterium]|nr:RidA family protein [Acidimicrobiia bacterium]